MSDTSKTQDELFKRLNTVFNEEIYIRNNFEAIPVSKFKIYDNLIDDYFLEGKTEDLLNSVKDHFKDYNSSVVARYMLGVIYLAQNKLDQKFLFEPLFSGFRNISKWNTVEHIASRILEFIKTDLNILEYKIEALEKQKKNQELESVLEILIKIDRKNPNHLKKYGLVIADQKPEEALEYIKKAIVIYLNQGKYEEFENIWPRVYKNFNNNDNIAYIEKIEKIIIRNKSNDRLPVYLYPVLDIYKSQEKWEQIIFICKKILEHQPDSNKARIEIIKSYKIKYKSHSLLNDFLKFSEIGNHKKPVLQCIQSFERNIVFDVNNYVSHRNWGVGKIINISSSDNLINIDFFSKKNHRFSIQMAIKSLKPIKKEHIWVLIHENKDLILEQFQFNPIEIVESYVKSFNGSILVSELKQEIISNKFLKSPSEWTKWWVKTTNLIKKHHHLVFDIKKKDKINYREKKLTFAEEQEEKFFSLSDNDLEKRLEIVLKVLDDISEGNQEDYLEKIEIFSNYFEKFLKQCRQYEKTFSFENEKTLSELINNNFFINNIIKKLYVYIYFIRVKKIQDDFSRNKDEILAIQDEKKALKDILLRLFIEKEFILNIFKLINSIEVKKKIIEIIPDILDQNEDQSYIILSHLIFDKSVKISKSIFNLLLKNSQYEILKESLREVLKDFKNCPDIFLTIASILLIHKEQTKKNTSKEDKIRDFQNYLNTKLKDKLTQKDLLLQVFRILKTVDKVETQGTKLKNMIASIIEPENSIFLLILKESNEQYLRKIYVLYKEVSFLPDWKKQEFYDLISKIQGGDQWWMGFIYQNSNDNKQKDTLNNKILVTQKIFNKKKEELDYLINTEMPANSKDIGEAQEKGDLRENAEYKAAMEKQNQLQMQIKNLESSLKKTEILDISNIDISEVNIGCTLKLKDLKNKQILEYSILGIWDANTEKNIISYESPLAKALMGKKIGERAVLFSSNHQKEYEVIEIQRYKE